MAEVLKVTGFSLLTMILAGCTWMDSDTASFFRGEKVLSRAEAISYLQTGILANMGSCPNNEAPGLFAINKSLPEELDRSFYYVSNLELCQVLLIATPCTEGVPTEAIITNLYRAIIRTCNPGPAA